MDEFNRNKVNKVDEVVADNIKQFINANLPRKSNTDVDARHAIVKVSLGANPENHREVKVRLEITNKTHNMVLNTQSNLSAHF